MGIMKMHKRFGFTLIEVTLFLAVTAVLFVGITVGTQGSIWQQRYYDSVQSFAEFLRTVYSQVSNPQSVGKGNSDTAIYGKLVVFGENYNLAGEEIEESAKRDYGQQIFVYDVVGRADVTNLGSGSTADLLGVNGARVTAAVPIMDESNKIIGWTLAGDATNYVPRWGAEIETVKDDAGETRSFTGSILIARNPRSGTINTLYSTEIIEVNKIVAEANSDPNNNERRNRVEKMIYNWLPGGEEANKFKDKEFESEQDDLIFCLNPYGYGTRTDNRREIRLDAGARNSSAVQIIDADSEDNECR